MCCGWMNLFHVSWTSKWVTSFNRFYVFRLCLLPILFYFHFQFYCRLFHQKNGKRTERDWCAWETFSRRPKRKSTQFGWLLIAWPFLSFSSSLWFSHVGFWCLHHRREIESEFFFPNEKYYSSSFHSTKCSTQTLT